MHGIPMNQVRNVFDMAEMKARQGGLNFNTKESNVKTLDL